MIEGRGSFSIDAKTFSFVVIINAHMLLVFRLYAGSVIEALPYVPGDVGSEDGKSVTLTPVVNSIGRSFYCRDDVR